MAQIRVGDKFPAASLKDTAGEAVIFPDIFSRASATVVFFYRGRW